MADETKEYRHPAPRKNVLLLSCMDARLLDQLVDFMNTSNLTNRYDHVVFAGAAMGVLHLSSPPHDGDVAKPSEWKHVFFHHLQVAIDVLHRPIRDIWILQHRDCGAFEHFHPTHNEPYGDDPADQELEETHHAEQAFLLARAIRDFCKKQEDDAHRMEKTARAADAKSKAKKRAAAWKGIHVRCFLMDLLGDVTHLKEE
jgi:carbonic anhydrase